MAEIAKQTSAHDSSFDDRRTCWVCFATDEDDREAAWTRPCRCKGTSRWVHQMCIQRWIDEKQQGNAAKKVACPQCSTEYLIVVPKSDRMLYKVCPFVAGGIVFGSVYWTAVTYGAVTIMQVLGHKEGLNVMERADPLFLLIGLPCIPVGLILGKMIRWEDYFLRLWRKHYAKIPILSSLFPESRSRWREPAEARGTVSDPMLVTRVLCGALVLPTLATVVGKLVFSSVNSNFQRTLLGGITFAAIKGTLKIYLKQRMYTLQGLRTILDYEQAKQRLLDITNAPTSGQGEGYAAPIEGQGRTEGQVEAGIAEATADEHDAANHAVDICGDAPE